MVGNRLGKNQTITLQLELGEEKSMRKAVKKKPSGKIKKPENNNLFPEPSELVLDAARMLDQKREELGIAPEAESFCFTDNLLAALELEKPSFQEYAQKSVMVPVLFVRDNHSLPLKVFISSRHRYGPNPGVEIELALRFCFCDRTLEIFPIRDIEPGASPWQKFYQARSLLHLHFHERPYRIDGWKVNNDWCRVVPKGAFVATPEGRRKTEFNILRKHCEDFLDFNHEKKFNRWLCTSMELGPASPITGVDELYNELKWLRQTAEGMVVNREEEK